MRFRRRLLNPRRRARRVPDYTVLRCPEVGHQASWCRCLCQPVGGLGVCGRPAPHEMKGRTQLAIARYNAARQGADGGSVR